ncbi:TetR/AcrR family transcriptional regulator [Paenibacillus periandrae]|uniref:TetR/AcrR family transcriptional regulator n=1 Tax=Paenibacillus periandrae TaxID=1761741 RepID=UPI001F09234C|nr:TetR family transcriptional regulator [Paenibacillus periandrae]
MARRQTTRISNSLIENSVSHIPLDRIRILETALKLLDEIGLKELSMRKIAEKLQVKTASLYYHVEDKEQFPNMIRLATYTTITNWENEFHFGLSVLIDRFSVKLMRGK